ncbi:MAG: DUF2071 domain-containing protein [Labilithrix sp.]|nr:DUF2071 domain-containing protein [Labilithrix sp.]MCW5816120.1 DUF2071 domain-containing protein [Labilithrix sp.]
MKLDRRKPERPEGANSGTQRWRELLFVHWSFDPEMVRKLVPRAFELDLWEGEAWVGLVPFRMEATRPSWLPRRAALDFLETNLRTYVHRDGKPGVYFFSLEASSWLAVRAARLGWGLPYHHAEMTVVRDGDRVAFGSVRKSDPRATLDVVYDVGEELGPSELGTLEHFLLERYYLFVQHKDKVLTGQVHHVPYPARRAELVYLEENLCGTAGLLNGRYRTTHYSDGVEVEVFGPA